MKKRPCNPAIPLCLLAALLGGCNDDDNNVITQPTEPATPTEPTPPSIRPAANIFGRVDGALTQPKTMTLSIASSISRQNPNWHHPVYDCAFNPAQHQFCNDGVNPAASQMSDVDVAALYGVTPHFDYDYILKDVQVDLTGRDWTTTRPELFQSGWGSVLDLLLIAAEQYDLDVEYFYDQELDTYWVTSINGVKGQDPATLPDPSQTSVPFAQCSEPGGWKFAYAASPWPTEHGMEFHTEESYKQIDRMPIGNQAKAFLIPACKEEIDTRKAIYQKEQKRLAANGGKMIVPEVVIDWAYGNRATFRNLEVTAHNSRPDIYQPGVITTMDIMLSLADRYPGIDVHFAWWPELSNDTMVNGYLLNAMNIDALDDNGKLIQGQYRASGTAGFVHNSGEWARYNDSGLTAVMYKNLMCNREHTGSELWGMPTTPCTGGTWRQSLPGQTSWTPAHWGDKVPLAPFGSEEGENKTYFSDAFGGNDVHMTMDLYPQVSPEYVNLYRVSFQMSDEYSTELMENGENFMGAELSSPLPPELQFTPFDINDAKAALTPDHFGWQQPDCGTCHSTEQGSGHVTEAMSPFECAQCHGNNGAPDGHGETTTCGFCHAKSLTLHGNAYQTGLIPESGWNETLYELLQLGFDTQPAQYYGLYTDYPEAASCLTCHPNR